MVSSCQALEEDLIIFSPGRGPMESRPLGQHSLIDSLRDLYVMATRARCNLIIVGSMEYMYENCPTWRTFIDHFRAQNNNYVFCK